MAFKNNKIIKTKNTAKPILKVYRCQTHQIILAYTILRRTNTGMFLLEVKNRIKFVKNKSYP